MFVWVLTVMAVTVKGTQLAMMAASECSLAEDGPMVMVMEMVATIIL